MKKNSKFILTCMISMTIGTAGFGQQTATPAPSPALPVPMKTEAAVTPRPIVPGGTQKAVDHTPVVRPVDQYPVVVPSTEIKDPVNRPVETAAPAAKAPGQKQRPAVNPAKEQ